MKSLNDMIKSLVLILVIFITACAPGLGSSLRVDRVKGQPVEELRRHAGFDMRVQVGHIADERAMPHIGQIDGRVLNPAGNVSISVKRTIERHLSESGVRVSEFNAPKIEGVIRVWEVLVQPGFPSTTLESKATIELSVYDQNDQRLYGGIYSGQALDKKPFFSEAEIEEHLGEAMGLAIREALGDEQMIRGFLPPL